MDVVGMRFHPTDEEIITHYLVNKTNGNNDLVDHVISEVDIYHLEPWNLPYHARRQSNDQVWYFFCHLQCSNSGRVNRKIRNGAGYWKATGKVRMVRASDSGVEIGIKRTLVFYSKDPSSGRGVKTDWVTHEYSLSTNVPSQLVLWKLKNKRDDWTHNEPHDEEMIQFNNNEEEADPTELEFADSCLNNE